MCEHYKYMLQLKPEFDIKFQKTGIHSQMVYLCEVEDVETGLVKLHYDSNRFNLLVKECGKCHICRFKRASIKACQCQSEYKTTKKGAFITLTFGNKQMTDYIMNDERFSSWSRYKKKKYINYLQWTLEKREFQLFMKRLRWRIYQDDLLKFSKEHGYFDNYIQKNGELRKKIIKSDKYDYSDFKPHKIRFLHAAEYGDAKQRPHHHCIILGINFSFDRSEVRWSWKQNKNVVVHFNNLLDELWPFGDITTDKVTYQSCNYVARYVTKKVVNKNKDYDLYDIAGSVYKGRLPEYCTQSNRKGLGYDYYMQNAHKINKDFSLTFKNNKGEIKPVPLPRYFKELMKRYFKSDWERLQKISLEKQLEFSQSDPLAHCQRMLKDRRKVKDELLKFKGDYEACKISSDKLNYLTFELKKQIFSDLKTFRKISLANYNDAGFTSEDSFLSFYYKKFENNRKKMYRNCINRYVHYSSKYPEYDKFFVKECIKTYNKILSLENPYKKGVRDTSDCYILV